MEAQQPYSAIQSYSLRSQPLASSSRIPLLNPQGLVGDECRQRLTYSQFLLM